MRLLAVLGALAILAASGVSAKATSLRAAPTTLELVAPDSAAVLNLRNEGERSINVQVRVFRWTQQDGVDRFETTTAVVASPPATSLKPGADYVVRVLRVSKAPIEGEESYRVIVDELPDAARRRNGTVTMVLRHSIPVFFRAADASAPAVSFSLRATGAGDVLEARNEGDTHLRLSDLTLSQRGRTVVDRAGLLGYVLGDATVNWRLPGSGRLSGGTAELSARGQAGPIDAAVDRR